MNYQLLPSDPKSRTKHARIHSVKQGTTGHKPVILKLITKQNLTTALYYAAVFLIICGAFYFASRVTHTSNTLKINQLELKSTQYKLQELNSQYDAVLQEKTATEAEKASQDAKVQELEKAKIELERQLQSKLAEKQRVASIQTAQVFAAGANCDTPKMCIYMKESGNNPLAVNSIGCRGIGQACPGTKLPCGADYACQDAWFTNYAIARYGSWDNAWVKWQQQGWW
jgi:hypothetical protein